MKIASVTNTEKPTPKSQNGYMETATMDTIGFLVTYTIFVNDARKSGKEQKAARKVTASSTATSHAE